MVARPLRFPSLPLICFSGSGISLQHKDDPRDSGESATADGPTRHPDTSCSRDEYGDSPSLPVPISSNVLPPPSASSTGSLIRVSLARLLLNDQLELQRLGEACREHGAFYLDLQMTEIGNHILEDADRLFLLGEQLFNLSSSEKEKYDMCKFGGYYGYKGYQNRMRDMKEFYAVSKDDILSIPCPRSAANARPILPQPSAIQSACPHIHSYIELSHTIVTILLRHLTALLKLPAGTLENLHRQSACSGDQVRWIKIQPSRETRVNRGDEVLLDEHSDSNSITVLFNRKGGLEVRQPYPHDKEIGTNQDGEFGPPIRWIKAGPLPGHCIIHLGEQIARLSSGVLRASVHRVCILPEQQRAGPRYSLVYFARPEDNVILQQLEGVAVVPQPHGPDKPGVAGETSKTVAWIARWVRRSRRRQHKYDGDCT
ncbi:predicted protein [Uncinocarpus reesii 1704]|uniref:Fe2OG dioxygenase domain-containing protein n=1 Tax=Uncinocarpus reesii (strain UAMH 1704) TaxID=336963 RepID=C4JQR6_UNCRE|nr:uncharacterized protein UREG_04733 [Uncinocarpus reesii 1704]EEP79887.1 predicted protein [Uncinocarpus reesii 1704]